MTSGKPWQLLLISQSFTGAICFVILPGFLLMTPASHSGCGVARLSEGLSSWVRRDGSSHRAALSFPLFHSDDDRQMQYAECTSIPGLPKNVGVIPDARNNEHQWLSHQQQTKSWLRPRLAIVPPPSKGEGSSTVCCSLSPRSRATGKPAYRLCQLLSSPAG